MAVIVIQKAPETMGARERVRRTFQYEPTDRVPIGYEDNPGIHKKVCAMLGVSPEDQLGLSRALGVDYLPLDIPYVGPQVYPEIPGRLRIPETGAVVRYVENAFGAYYDFCDFPLADADDEALDAYPFPSPDDYDYEAGAARLRYLHQEGFAVHMGNAGWGDILNSTGTLMGVEEALVRMATEDPATLAMIDRRLAMQLGILERILDRVGREIDFLWTGEDLGSQNAPLISQALYDRVLKPRHQQFIDLAHSYHIPVIMHTCGASSWVYETLIQMGMDGVDTLQPEAKDMEPASLVRRFGGRLNFRGCISTAGPLANGTADEVTAVCRETLTIMKSCRGYHFAPTHQIQDNTPPENVIAMYQAAHDFGRY